MTWLHFLIAGHLVVNAGALLIALIQLLGAIGASVFRDSLFWRAYSSWLLHGMYALLISSGLIANWLSPAPSRACQTAHTYEAARDTVKILSDDISNIQVLQPSLAATFDTYESAMSSMYVARAAMSSACVQLAITPAQDWVRDNTVLEEEATRLQAGNRKCEESAIEVEDATRELRWTVAGIKEDALAALQDTDGRSEAGRARKSLENSIATCVSIERSIDVLVQGPGHCLDGEADVILKHWKSVRDASLPMADMKAAIERERFGWRCAP